MTMKKGPKLILGALILLGLFFGFQYAAKNGWIPMGKVAASQVPELQQIPTEVPTTQTNTTTFVQPSSSPTSACKNKMVFDIWAWNSQAGWILSNGGQTTTKGSLMEKYGACVSFKREDMVDKMQADLLTFAEELQNTPQPTKGAHGVAIMGDGAAAFLQAINPKLEKLGPEYTAVVIGSAGYSRGEDKFMGLPAWKTDPQQARGALIAGVLRDGDWNIAVKWADDNEIPINPSEKTWDPNALNFVNAESYIDASQKYIAGYSENRIVVKDGKMAGTQKVEVNGVVTWTPGDVMVAQKKGGLVNIASTYEYRAQMPNTIIMIKKWAEANRSQVVGMLRAIGEAGDMIKTDIKALKYATQLSAGVYKEETPEYWLKYFDRVTERDAQGLKVELGGSAVNNLADMQQLFGLAPGSLNLFEATYTTFGNAVVKLYPDLVPTYPPIYAILNTSFVEEAAAQGTSGRAEAAVFDASAPITATVSNKSWGGITFATGSASFTTEALRFLEKLKNDMAIAGGLAIEIHGHTDSTGDPTTNLHLSQLRADAVKAWLEKAAPSVFPHGRIRTFGHGQEQPVASNSTSSGKAQNRRVEIRSGTQ